MKFNFTGKTILVVDDDLTSLLLFNEILEGTGALVVCMPDGMSALNSVKSTHFDIILLDIKLTDISGYNLLIEIKKLNVICKVIAQTALSTEAYKKCMDAGFDDYITKPINSLELFAKIKSNLNLSVRQ